MTRSLFVLTALTVLTVLSLGASLRNLSDEDTQSKTKRGWLGVSISDVTERIAKEKQLKSEDGAYVTDVVDESPADSIGLKKGDVIVEFAGRTIYDANDLAKAVNRTEPGTKTSLVALRKGEKKTYQVVIGKLPRRARTFGFNFAPQIHIFHRGQFLPRHTSNPKAAIENAPAVDVRILLAHQPVSLFAALPLGFDLQISGHTHGGQFFPWNIVAALGQPYISGLHKHDQTWIYVSRGTGYWGPPVRLASRSEVTVLKLTREHA